MDEDNFECLFCGMMNVEGPEEICGPCEEKLDAEFVDVVDDIDLSDVELDDIEDEEQDFPYDNDGVQDLEEGEDLDEAA